MPEEAIEFLRKSLVAIPLPYMARTKDDRIIEMNPILMRTDIADFIVARLARDLGARHDCITLGLEKRKLAQHLATNGPEPRQIRTAFMKFALPCVMLKNLKAKLDEHSWLKDRYIIFPNVSGEGKFSLLRNGMAPKYKDMPFVGGYLDGSKDGLKPGTINILSGKEKAWGHKRIACIQTSDNRREDHSDLGVHSSWIKWASPTAEALRQACLAQESRISDTEPSISSVVITSVSV